MTKIPNFTTSAASPGAGQNPNDQVPKSQINPNNQIPNPKQPTNTLGNWSLFIGILLGFGNLVIWISTSTAQDHSNASNPTNTTLRLLHTHHYDIHTDIDQPLADDLAARMDVMYDQYGKTLSDFKLTNNPPPLAVYLFQTHAKYMAFTDYAGTNTGGLFVAGRRSYLAAYEQGQGRDSLRRTLQHEAFHQFAHAAISHHLPRWMNEGIAQLFEESIWIGKDFLTDQIPPRRLRQLHADIIQKRLVDFDQFMALSPSDWRTVLHTNRDKANLYYNQAWVMACFCSAAGDPAYRSAFNQLLHKLHDNQIDPDTATHQCFPDLKDMRKKFNAWAAKLTPSPQAALQERQDTLADFLQAVTQKNHPAPADLATFRNTIVRYNMKIQYTRNNITYTTAESPLIYFSNLDGKVFTPAELYFQANPDAALPDIVCQPAGDTYRYRTHFYNSTEHEQLIETTNDER
jgi:hypothetical protein